MHLRTALLLLALVLGLGGLALWQLRREDAPGVGGQRELVPELARDAIGAVRLDSLQWGLQMRIARDDEGVWGLTDPLVYPVDPSVVSQLLDALTLHPAEPWEGDPVALGLRPPRAVLEIELAGGGAPTHRLELGALDVDRQHVFLSVDGQLVRTTSTLSTLVDLPLPEWRRREILPEASPFSVISFTRSGRATLPGLGEVDLELEVVREDGWRATRPFLGRLGPEAVGTLLTSLCSVRAAGFEGDAPGPLRDYGLEPPDFRVELTTLSGQSYALRFAQRADSDRLLCVREDMPNVFAVAPETIAWLLAPADALVDLELARVPRERVTRLRLLAEGGETLIEREGFGWRVSATGGPQGGLAPQKADTQGVEDLLGRIERTRVVEVLPEVAFVPSDPPVELYVESEAGVQGGELGALHASARGTEGILFRRTGDTLVTLMEKDVLGLARTDPGSLLSDELHKVAELDVAQVQVVAAWAEARRTWGRDERSRWIPLGSSAEALDFARIVDQLLSVRARRLLEPSEQVDAVQPVAVALVDLGGRTLQAFALQLVSGSAEDPEGAEVLYVSGERRGLVDGRLYFALRELLGIP